MPRYDIQHQRHIFYTPTEQADLILIAPASPIASLRNHPDNSVAARLAAQSFPGLGTLVTAAYRRFLTPEQLTEARLDIAQTLATDGDPDAARAVLEEALAHDPTRFDLRLRLGHLAIGPEPVPGETVTYTLVFSNAAGPGTLRA